MQQPPVDRPLSVERLTPAELIAAARAVATILAICHAGASAPGQVSFSLTVRWDADPAGERWAIVLTDPSAALDHDVAAAEAGHLLQPILQLMRPRAVSHFFRSRMDEATLEDIDIIGNAGVLPSAEAFEPRWVEDRTVLVMSPGIDTDGEALKAARVLLADIRGRLSR